MSDFEAQARETECCACDHRIGEGGHINMVALNKRAEWDSPTMGNVMYDIPSEYAVAVVCDACIDSDAEPHYAVRGEDDGSLERVPVGDLEDLEPMRERAEAGVRWDE